MITDGVSASVAAGATTNLALGRPIEFVGVASRLQLFIVADAALQTVQLLLNVGGTQLAPVAAGSPVNVASVAGAGPKLDEDLIADVAVPAGARLQLNLTNGAAAAVISRYRAILS